MKVPKNKKHYEVFSIRLKFQMLVFLCFALSASIFSQQSSRDRQIDSLRGGFGKNPNDTSRIRQILELSQAFFDVNKDSALAYALMAEQQAEKKGWKKGIGNANTAIGLIHAANFEHKQATDKYDKALKNFRMIGDRHSIAAVYANKSLVFLAQGDYAKALELAFAGLGMLEELNDTIKRPRVLETIGTIYMRQRKYEKTHEYYEQATDFYRRAGDKIALARVLGNRGIVLNEQHEFSKALEYHLSAYNVNKIAGTMASQQINLTNLGITYTHLKRYREALNFYEQALRLSRQLKNKSSIAVTLGNMGELYYTMAKTGNHAELVRLTKKAVEYLEESVRMCEELNFTGPYLEFMRYLSDAQLQLADYEAALKTFKEYTAVHDSVFDQESRVRIAAIEQKREQEVMNRDLQLKRQQREIEKLRLARKRNERLLFALCIVFLVTGLVLLYRLYRLRNTRHRQVLSNIATIQSHEVRGPLARILGLLALIDPKELSEENRKMLEYLHHSAKELDEVVKKTVEVTYDK